MKTIIGSAIGVAAIGLIVIFAGLRGNASSAPAGIPTYSTASPNASPVLVNDPSARSAVAGPVMINCAPGQRALVRQVALNGEPVSQVACVTDPAPGLAAGNAAPVSRLAQPVSYRARRAATVAERRVVYQEPVTRRVAEKEGSSWKKPLLVIGGSTAAGAGIGGLVGGKKGALIGAALGGGASTLLEAMK